MHGIAGIAAVVLFVVVIASFTVVGIFAAIEATAALTVSIPADDDDLLAGSWHGCDDGSLPTCR
jgi:hypothetical protein